MRALLLAGILTAGAFVLSGCGSDKVEQPKNPVQYDAARDGVPDVVGPGMKKGPKSGLSKGAGEAIPVDK